MSRRAASITQADVARVIRAAKQAGAVEVIMKIGEQSITVRLKPTADKADKGLEPGEEIVL